jgi:prophage maintenance system killer protein
MHWLWWDTFLQLNGHELSATEEPELVSIFVALAAGELSEKGLAEWIAAKSRVLLPEV